MPRRLEDRQNQDLSQGAVLDKLDIIKLIINKIKKFNFQCYVELIFVGSGF